MSVIGRYSLLLVLDVLSVLSLDPDQKDSLVEVIEKLLKDQTTVTAIIVLKVGLVLAFLFL